MIVFILWRERNSGICSNMNDTWGYYVKGHKPNTNNKYCVHEVLKSISQSVAWLLQGMGGEEDGKPLNRVFSLGKLQGKLWWYKLMWTPSKCILEQSLKVHFMSCMIPRNKNVQEFCLSAVWKGQLFSSLDETWIGVYTAKDCYPVQETFIRNYTVVLSTRFFDVQLGIKDPSVFTPPSTCQTAQPEKMKENCSLWISMSGSHDLSS